MPYASLSTQIGLMAYWIGRPSISSKCRQCSQTAFLALLVGRNARLQATIAAAGPLWLHLLEFNVEECTLNNIHKLLDQGSLNV
jgi:hypothetical protein